MSPDADHDLTLGTCFPRVSGDEPRLIDWLTTTVPFSPRERG